MDRTKLIKIFLEQNFNIAADALDYIMQKKVSERILRERITKIPPDIPVINLSTVKKYLEPYDPPSHLIKEKSTGEISKSIQISDENYQTSKGVKERITESLTQPEKVQETTLSALRPFSRVTIKLDIPERTSAKPDFSAFRQLFHSRFEQLSNIFMENYDNSDVILEREIREEEISREKSGILIGMVQDTRVLHTNKFVIQLEDPQSGIITNCVMVQDSPSFPEYRDILRDTVIGISGVLPKNFREGPITAFWGKDVIRPGFLSKQFKPTSDPHRILFIADLHFGSKYFSRGIFAKLIKFLTLEGLDPIYKTIAKEIDTIIIAGDLVDGVGRFPDQKSQISTHSFQAQYEGLATVLMEIPSHIQILIIPGEHDATQAALPQPAIDRQICQALLAMPNLTSHGNPLRLSLEDLNLLVFHGQGNYELFQKHYQKAHSNPSLAIKELLEYRHLYPEYGSYNPLAPFKRDYLVIDEIPDIVISGHLHHAYFEEYKGIKIITCGTFQRDNQRKAQLEGNVSLGIIPILDTASGNVEMIDLKTL
ncbi:MAG: metallophosphoesterase [Candidatus Hodarchaeota archaeon]